MDVHDLLASLVRDEDRVPRERIDDCALHGAAMVEALNAVVGPEALGCMPERWSLVAATPRRIHSGRDGRTCFSAATES
ncbi:MAG: hypothetical protein CV088_19255 [Nitrospira sp. LK70]|nr:hypothetical protein [Nitrospira sp. LK70]